MRRLVAAATKQPSAAAKQPRGLPADFKPAPAVGRPRVILGDREHRFGRIVSVGPQDIFVEFGPKELGVAPRTQWGDDELPPIGEDLEVVIERYDPDESLFTCAKPGAVQKADWELLQKGQILEAVATGVNKGGLELEVANHRAFMPASQIDIRHIDDPSKFIGQKLTCVVRKVDRAGRGNIILSRRDLLAKERKEKRGELQEKLKVGQQLEGEVVSIQPFGAFVDIGGVEGLVHVTDISHERIKKPEDKIALGDSVKVQITKLDWDDDRISLSMKAVEPDPFQVATETVKEGEEISGRVTKTMEFGAFVEVAPGVEGLVHISELSWQRVNTVEQVVKADQIVKVKVVGVDPEKKRVSLSIKQLIEPPAPPKGSPGRGRGRGRGDQDTRSPDEIKKETPEFRRLREQAQKEQKQKGLTGGFGARDLGKGLGDLKL